MRTSWLRVRTPVFSKSCCSTALTELSEIESRAPISLFVSPSNTPLSTACSRWVKPPLRRGAAALPVAAAIIERVTAGSSQTSPAMTFRMASLNRLGGLCFRKTPDEPFSSARSITESFMPAVTIRMRPANPALRA